MQLFNKIESNKKLIIFFAGWGMDENPFLSYLCKDYDIAIIYNYCSISTINNISLKEINNPISYFFENYNEIYLIAWSMGVWGADECFKQILNCANSSFFELFNSKLKYAIAINGTLTPINDTTGIPCAIYNGTIESMPASLRKFNLRMCGGKNVLDSYNNNPSQRDQQQIKEELIAIKENFCSCASSASQNTNNQTASSQVCASSAINWNCALISSNDLIFPTANQQNFWSSRSQASQGGHWETSQASHAITSPTTLIKEIQSPHYPFYLWNSWDQIIDLCTSL